MNASLNWEEFFIQEALELEEKMTSLDLDSLNRSRLRISLEKNILDWNKYQAWIFSVSGIKCFNFCDDLEKITSLIPEAQTTFQSYSKHNFWNEDLIPVAVWDQHLIVFGLSYNSNLASIENCIFILATPSALSLLAQNLFGENTSITTNAVSELDFSSLKAGNTKISEDEKIWDYLHERHEEYSFEVKKIFNAYAVLKIKDNKTALYKMDFELENSWTEKDKLQFDLSQTNPFSAVFKSGSSESFNINQLGFSIMHFKYVCITALKRGSETVGFLVGFKSSPLAETDQHLLEDLAKESA